jgi:hypothetical protein
MKKPLSFTEFSDLIANKPQPYNFGPNSENPYLAFNLNGSDDSLSDWISNSPCPIIGIGEGKLKTKCDLVIKNTKELPLISKNITEHPFTSMVLIQLLRATEKLSMPNALTVESFAFSTVQKGIEFKKWLPKKNKVKLPQSKSPDLHIISESNNLSIILNRADTNNAITTKMRDELNEILDMAIIDKNISKISLSSNGKIFSAGGAVEEFGLVSDPASAHWIRSVGLPAKKLIQLQDKLCVTIRGGAVGAGIEMAAFSKKIVASQNSWFQLPELKYGLIPGAGGTVSIPRRIGRQNTAYMAITTRKVSAKKALEWGLIDAIKN